MWIFCNKSGGECVHTLQNRELESGFDLFQLQEMVCRTKHELIQFSSHNISR